ncbi:MAG: M18 family aminopeptidase [Anaeroplasmataceae bacterium]|nr:M18 family aminopeptidase [Anaeroplasmataceae bacterium]
MKNFLNFIKNTPTAFHAAEKIKDTLVKAGYIELEEQELWNLKKGGKYFFTRNMSSLLAFELPIDDVESFHITAAHLDSPTFKLKPHFTLEKGRYLKLNTEVYGGPIYASWMDRPLGIAGRVFIEKENKVKGMLVNLDEPLVMIPSLPIHYNRNVNSGVELNPQIDLLPLFSENKNDHFDVYDLIAQKLEVKKESIISSDLYLTVLDRGTLAGAHQEFVMAPQIDNLECSYGLLEALLQSKPVDSINVCAFFDNEEIGSSTNQGAFSTMLDVTLRRIMSSLGKSVDEYYKILSNSLMISADNAQGFHPNYPQKYDEGNACYLNEGIVIKNAARGSYSTDAFSSACFQKLCKLAEVKYQLNTNRSDVLGGSTLGAISIRQVSIPSVDIGLAQLAMHSAYETAGSKDLEELVKVIRYFYNHSLKITKDFTIFYF